MIRSSDMDILQVPSGMIVRGAKIISRTCRGNN